MIVSVCVLTYNSAKYVLETLESIYSQTYQAISLVISDDSSTDCTIKLVNDWIDLDRVHKRFISIKVITVPQNTGVSANCNRIIQTAKTDWIKFIAGDDILLPNCMHDNIEFAKSNPNSKVFFSQVKVFQDAFDDENYIYTTPANFPDNLFHNKLTAKDQFELLCVCDRIHFTPSYMFHKSIIDQVGYYDESNRLVEDYPMWLKLTEAKIKLHYFHKPTVGYRIHAQATNNKGNKLLFKPSVINNFSIRKKVCHKYLPWEMVASEYHQYLISKLFLLLGLNFQNKFTTILYKLCCFYLNPFHYVFAMKKRFPSTKNNFFYQ